MAAGEAVTRLYAVSRSSKQLKTKRKTSGGNLERMSIVDSIFLARQIDGDPHKFGDCRKIFFFFLSPSQSLFSGFLMLLDVVEALN